MRLRPSQLQLSLNPSDVCSVVAGPHQCEIALRGDTAVNWWIVYGRKAQNGWVVIWGKVVLELLGWRRNVDSTCFSAEWTTPCVHRFIQENSTLWFSSLIYILYQGTNIALGNVRRKYTCKSFIKAGCSGINCLRRFCFIIQCTVFHQILPRNISFYFIKSPLLIFFSPFSFKKLFAFSTKTLQIDSSAQLSSPSPPLPSLVSSLPASPGWSWRIIWTCHGVALLQRLTRPFRNKPRWPAAAVLS